MARLPRRRLDYLMYWRAYEKYFEKGRPQVAEIAQRA
jgi:hypothetical protein